MIENLKERVAKVRAILEGTTTTFGAGTWFAGQIAESGFTRPSDASVSRWFAGKFRPSSDAVIVLYDLEERARKKLRVQIEEIGK